MKAHEEKFDWVGGTPFNPPGYRPCLCMRGDCPECKTYVMAEVNPVPYQGERPTAGPHRQITRRETLEQEAAMNGGLGVAEARKILNSLPRRKQYGGVKKTHGKASTAGKALHRRIQNTAAKLKALVEEYDKLSD